MYVTFKLKKDDLNKNFIETLKKLFVSDEIEVTVSPSDETEHLLRSSKNKKRLLSAIKNIRTHKHLIEVKTDKLL
jgi:hypothetical protein